MNASRTRAPARAVLALVLTLFLGTAVRAETDDDTGSSSDPGSSGVFPWIAFVMSVAAIGGLAALVRRRQREVAAEDPTGRGRVRAWYCRGCRRDAVGPACRQCGAANPFLDDAPDPAPRPVRPPARHRAAR
jgi:hypothetical protein